MHKLCNFNAGPAMLPPSVLEQVQAELRDCKGSGMSIMEMSHRSKEYEAVNAQAEAGFKRLLGVGAGYRVVFLQGGASTQFAMLPMNFLPPLTPNPSPPRGEGPLLLPSPPGERGWG